MAARGLRSAVVVSAGGSVEDRGSDLQGGRIPNAEFSLETYSSRRRHRPLARPSATTQFLASRPGSADDDDRAGLVAVDTLSPNRHTDLTA